MFGPIQKLGWAVAAAIFIADQISKQWILHGLSLVEGESVAVIDLLSLTLVYNRGISLGLFQAETDIMRWGLVVLTAGISVYLAIWLTRAHNRMIGIAAGLIIGGAVGNIIDRVIYGYVIDFVDVHIPFWNYIFNVADAAITIGVILVLIDGLLLRRQTDTQKT